MSPIQTARSVGDQDYHPNRPISLDSPLFRWPPQPRALLKWLFACPGYLFPWGAFFLGLAYVSWRFLTPDIAQAESLSLDWILLVLLRNLVLLVAFNSIWHYRLYVRKAQGNRFKYNKEWPSDRAPQFLFDSQLRDNVFWSICSAVPIWSLLEIATLWLHANGFAPAAPFNGPWAAYNILLFLFLPLLSAAHFYAIHRLIHVRPLFRYIHRLHHKNVNVGPWSGLAMHPLEHLLYFSTVVMLWLIPSNPLHAIFLLQYKALSATLSHHGFGRVVLADSKSVDTDHYMHYLHHRYFIVNYGVEAVPLDKWFGTFHDGTQAAHDALRQRQAARFPEIH